MSLNDLDNREEEHEEINPRRKQNKRFFGRLFNKLKISIIILVIGLIIGLLLGQFFVAPLFTEQSSSCENCIASKELLLQENNCLYTLLTTEEITQCSSTGN